MNTDRYAVPGDKCGKITHLGFVVASYMVLWVPC